MRRTTLALIGAVLVLNALPAAAASSVACDDDGRERFPAAGLNINMPAPVASAPELAATADGTGRRATPYRTASFPYVADFAPADAGAIDVKLAWDNPSDFDISVIDADGNVIASSLVENIPAQSWTEALTAELVHCQPFTILVRSWAGSPAETLNLKATIASVSESKLACAAGDSAPNCAGKPAGAAPDATPADTRTRLYLGGDPGQASMAHAYVATTGGQDVVPFRGTLSPGRPISGQPNQYTRPALGLRNQFRNPFMAHFSTTFAQPRDLNKDVDALLYLSSPTMKDGGKLFVDLYADGNLVNSVEVAGTKVPEAPNRPVAVRIPVGPEQALEAITSLTLQIGADPAAGTTGPGNPNDGVFTVHYGGTQFPSLITLK